MAERNNMASDNHHVQDFSASENGNDEFLDIPWEKIKQFFSLLRNFSRLFGVILFVCLVFSAVIYAVYPRTYVAIAEIGPPSASPVSSMLDSQSSFSSLGAKALGSSSGSSRDPYMDFQQLLTSSILSGELVKRDHFLQIIMASKWNAKEKRWNDPSPFEAAIASFKEFLGANPPQKNSVEYVISYLNRNLHWESIEPKTSSGSLFSKSSPYITVSFSYKDPKEAVNILQLILRRVDQIVREKQILDVSSRIKYLQELSTNNVAVTEKDAYISILASQKQMMAMLHADSYYACNVVVPPYASPRPVSPPGVLKMLGYVLLISLLLWAALVYAAINNERMGKLLAWSYRPRR